MSLMGGLDSDVCWRRMGQANTEWNQHFMPSSISIWGGQPRGESHVLLWPSSPGPATHTSARAHRQLVLVAPDPRALPLLNHGFDVHQHGQRHAAGGKAAGQRAGLQRPGQDPSRQTKGPAHVSVRDSGQGSEVAHGQIGP